VSYERGECRAAPSRPVIDAKIAPLGNRCQFAFHGACSAPKMLERPSNQAQSTAMKSPQDATAVLTLSPVIPVVTIDDAANAVPLARVLLASGVNTIEITLRTRGA
jgi:KDPG and KHG aldolase